MVSMIAAGILIIFGIVFYLTFGKITFALIRRLGGLTDNEEDDKLFVTLFWPLALIVIILIGLTIIIKYFVNILSKFLIKTLKLDAKSSSIR